MSAPISCWIRLRSLKSLLKKPEGFVKQQYKHIACSSQRYLSNICIKNITYKEHGDPTKVLELQSNVNELTPLKSKDVLVGMKASPINPADINMIQGVYAVKPPLPAVGGNEGIGEVLEVGADVTTLTAGDWVLTSASGMGTWSTHVVGEAGSFRRVAKDIPLLSAATLGVNVCTAYRMLRDFVSLKTGDVVIQNGANSGVGVAAIQIMKAWNVRSVNIVRERETPEEQGELEDYLKGMGATHVMTDKQVRSGEGKEFLRSLYPAPLLGLNCVGGKSGADVARWLGPRGTLVSYGAMSKQPLMLPTAAFIFQDIRAVGFWMTRWNEEHHDTPEAAEMLDELVRMIRAQEVRAPQCHVRNIDDFREAIGDAMAPKMGRKQVFVMD